MSWYRSMRPIGCLVCLIIFTIEQTIAREHSIRKHETWFWEPFNPDLGESAGATYFNPHTDHIIANNVYFHTNRFYSLIETTTKNDIDDDTIQHSKNFAYNAAITPLPVTNVSSFLENIKSGWISGTTLLIPFPESDFPHHMGLWIKILAPVYSYLVRTTRNNGTSSVRTVLIPNLSRGTVMSSSWVMDILKIATTMEYREGKEGSEEKYEKEDGKEKRVPAVRILFWDDLEHTPLDSWLGFERILHVYSRYTTDRDNGAKTTVQEEERKEENKFGFASPEIAENFRLAVHRATGIPAPVPGAPVPLTITYLMPTDSSGVTNNKNVLETLQKAAEAAATTTDTVTDAGTKRTTSPNSTRRIAVRPYSPTPSVPLASLVAVMSRTGLLIGRHAPLLANAVFLPPGAAVVEILPYNGNSGGHSDIYRNLTASRSRDMSIEMNSSTNSCSTAASCGVNTDSTSASTSLIEEESILHVAWRAPSGNWMRYESDEDSRYSSWTPVECSSEHCIDAHTRAGVEVNIDEFEKIVNDVLKILVVAEERQQGERQENVKFSLSELKGTVRDRYPWPKKVQLTGTSGLWWDRGG